MAGLSIPERHRVGAATVGSFSEEAFGKLIETLKTASPSDTAEDLVAQIEKEVPSSSGLPVEKMIAALTSMQAVQHSSHVEPARFASDVWDALSEDSPERVKDIDPEILKSRIIKFISETDVQLTSVKIDRLRNEVERSFCGARILTDIRAAFLDDASKRPPAMTILHTLEIRYHDDSGKHREFYVSVDDNDLLILKDAINRAEQKRETLRELLTNADFKLYE